MQTSTTKLIRRVTRRAQGYDAESETGADDHPEARGEMVVPVVAAEAAVTEMATAKRPTHPVGASPRRGVVDFICKPSAPTMPGSETGEQEPEDFSGGYSRCMAQDGVHPNAAGYSIWAKHIGTKLGDLLMSDQTAEAAATALPNSDT